MHDVPEGVVFDENGDVGVGGRGEKAAGLVSPVPDLCPVPVETDAHASVRRADQGIRNSSVGEGVHGDVNLPAGVIDHTHIDRLEIFLRRVVFPQESKGEGSPGRRRTFSP